jgi:hypothetical protein
VSDERGTEISFMPIPITGTIGCAVPVLPGSADVDAPLEDRTELCAMDANWLVGAVPTCDHHARVVCETVDIDWPGVLAEAGRETARPWRAGERHPQDAARRHLAHFTEAAAPYSKETEDAR